MANTMTEKERKMIPELITIAQKLSAEDREHLIWLGWGILFASNKQSNEGKAS